MMRFSFSISITLLVACGGPTASIDAGSDAPSGCGDGARSHGEACDGETLACTELAASWSGGDATCRRDCGGWDVSACARPTAPPVEVVKPSERDPGRWSGAVCNDGTPFSMFVRLAPEPSSRWVIHLQGGVFCDDYALSCADRLREDPQLTTTLSAGDRQIAPIMVAGLHSNVPAVNPDFASVNHAIGVYCSSDFWSGEDPERRPSSADPAGWHFAGRANVSAMLEILVDRYGLSDADPETRVLWGGSSAGAFGAQFNVPRIRTALPTAFADGRVHYFGDAPWMIPFEDPAHRVGAATVPDRDVWRGALEFWGGRVNEDCEAALTDPIDCWFGAGWYPIVSAQLPVLVQQSEIDGSFGFWIHGFGASCDPMGRCTDPDDQATVDAWRAQSVASLADVEWLFSGSMRYHTLAGSDESFGIGPPAATLREVLARFWDDGAPERVLF